MFCDLRSKVSKEEEREDRRNEECGTDDEAKTTMSAERKMVAVTAELPKAVTPEGCFPPLTSPLLSAAAATTPARHTYDTL